MTSLFWDVVGWAMVNLVFPLGAIGIVLLIQWLSNKRVSLSAVIKDGQVCFYAVGILAAAYYDLQTVVHSSQVSGMSSWTLVVGSIAAVGYGLLAADHLGAHNFSTDRAAILSWVVGIAAFFLAFRTRYIIAAVGVGGHVP
jgi:hypothetical protein